jgi:hypothetical protein
MSDEDTASDGGRSSVSEGRSSDEGDGSDDSGSHHHGGDSHGHDHGPSERTPVTGEGLSLAERIAAFREWVDEWAHGLYHGMIEHPAFEKIEKEAEDVEDVFLFACFADAFGIPSPVSYYTVELLPYLAEEFEQWERRMWDRKSLLERKGQQYHFH